MCIIRQKWQVLRVKNGAGQGGQEFGGVCKLNRVVRENDRFKNQKFSGISNIELIQIDKKMGGVIVLTDI